MEKKEGEDPTRRTSGLMGRKILGGFQAETRIPIAAPAEGIE